MSVQHQFSNRPHIYLIEHVESGKKYVGQSCGSTKGYFCGGTYIRNAIKKHGKQAFTRTILEEGDFNQSQLDRLETQYIKKYDAANTGYNILEEGHRYYQANTIPWNKGGGVYTPEMIDKMSNAKIGKKATEETKQKMSQARLGKTMPEGHGEKISEKISKPTLQYTLSGEFVQEFPSATIAAEAVGSNFSTIAECSRGEIKSAAGFQWRYKWGGLIPETVRPCSNIVTNQIVQMTLEGEVVRTWDSAKQCAEEFGCDSGNLRMKAKKGEEYRGYKWSLIKQRGQ